MTHPTRSLTKTSPELEFSMTMGEEPIEPVDHELVQRYRDVVNEKRFNWTTHYRLQRLLGTGGQGCVYLTERRGADGFTLPVALKVFSPEHFREPKDYDEAMQRAARIAVRVAQIQHDNLLDVQNFVDRNRVRILVMEWVDGYDLHKLLNPAWMEKVRAFVPGKRWEYLNRVVVTMGPAQVRFQPGVAVSIVKEVLGALGAMHREGLVHGDIKPSNIMLKCTGSAKLIDIGSTFDVADPPPSRTITPAYAAPEVLEGAAVTQRSDLASLGYVLIEMLSGRQPFAGIKDYKRLLEMKRLLPQTLDQIMPAQVSCNPLLMNLCRLLTAPDPMRRFASAEAADMDKEGAASFLRQLIVGDLASEYGNEIRHWLSDLHDAEEPPAE